YCSGTLAGFEKYELRRLSLPPKVRLTFRSEYPVPSAVPRSEYTNPASLRAPLLPAERDAALARGFEYCSASFAPFLALPASLRAAGSLPESGCERARASPRLL